MTRSSSLVTRRVRIAQQGGALLGAALLLLITVVVPNPAMAGIFTWGDLMGDNIMYLNVEEENDVDNALFAPNPDPSPVGVPQAGQAPKVVGDQIILDPQNFDVEDTGGDPVDFLDSQLSTTLMAKEGRFIQNIHIREDGDYTLTGGPNGVANVSVGAQFFVTVLEIDGQPMPLPTHQQSMMVEKQVGPGNFVPDADGKFERVGDDGTANGWRGQVLIDVGQILADNGKTGFATKVELKFDNSITAFADQDSIAFLKKKEIGGIVITPNIPEPCSAILAGLAAVGLAMMRRRRG